MFFISMKKNIFHAILFFAMPVGLLITAAIRMGPMYKGRSACVWLEQMQMVEQSPGMEAMRALGKDAVPVLQKALHSQQAAERVKAAWALGHLGPVARSAVPDLIQALDDKFPNAQIVALQSIEAIDVYGDDLIPKVIEKLGHPHPGVCNSAANLLTRIEQKRKAESLPMVNDEFDYDMAFLHSPASRVRLMGMRKLAKFSKEDKRVAKALTPLLNDSNMVIREEAAMRLRTYP
jgi:HEAT repeat protein